MDNHNTDNNTPDSGNNETSPVLNDIDNESNGNETTNRGDSVGLFERLMDTVLGLQHRNETNTSNSNNSGATSNGVAAVSNTESPVSDNAASSSNNTDTPASNNSTSSASVRSGLPSLFQERNVYNASLSDTLLDWAFPSTPSDAPGRAQDSTLNVANHSNSLENANPESTNINVVPLPEGLESESSRGIVITVNYVFSDENNPLHPNRSGSLVMSLPNNSSNRDPEFIQQLIRFATQMAYSSIITGLQKEKGLTKEKFDSFPAVDYENLGDSKNCNICFEEMEKVHNHRKDENLEQERSFKKRKLHDRSASSTPVSTDSESPLPTSSAESQSTKKLLSEYTGTYDHIPIELPCHHIFGKSCLLEWLKDHITCPLCRKDLVDPSEVNTTNNNRNLTILTLPNTTATAYNSEAPTNTEHGGIRHILRPIPGLQNIQHPAPEQSAISHILGYLRRQRQDTSENEPLFPSGVSSRRTASGVETTLTGDDNNRSSNEHESNSSEVENGSAPESNSTSTINENNDNENSNQD